MTVEIETEDGKKKITDGVKVDSESSPNAEKKAKAAGRKPMPKVDIPDRHRDYRAEQLAELNARNDGYEYKYASKDITDWDLEVQGAELVKYEDGPKKGRKMHHKGDPIIRVDKAKADAERIADGKFSEQQVRESVKVANPTVKANPRKPEPVD